MCSATTPGLTRPSVLPVGSRPRGSVLLFERPGSVPAAVHPIESES